MISEKERKIARIIQGDLPLSLHPFKELEPQTGLTEEEILKSITDLMGKGLIRRFGAVIRHQMAGYTENAMVVWAVPEDRRASVGKLLASFSEITHCYERTPPFEGKYALFSMVHFHAGEREGVLRKLSEATGITDFLILDTEEEYKKTSMEYFNNG
jgi:siroheme decarboxylase